MEAFVYGRPASGGICPRVAAIEAAVRSILEARGVAVPEAGRSLPLLPTVARLERLLTLHS